MPMVSIGSGESPRREQRRLSHYDRPSVRDPRETGGDVASKAVERQVGAQPGQLGPTALAARGDRCSRPEVGQTTADQRVPGVAPLGYCRQAEARGGHRR